MGCGCNGSNFVPPAERAAARAAAREKRLAKQSARKTGGTHQGQGYRWTGPKRADAS